MRALEDTEGFTRNLAIGMFHDSIWHREHYQTETKTSLTYATYKERPEDKQPSILEEVLDFCLDTGACEKLGLSMTEMMDLDRLTFDTIKARVRAQLAKEHSDLPKLPDPNKLLGVKK